MVAAVMAAEAAAAKKLQQVLDEHAVALAAHAADLATSKQAWQQQLAAAHATHQQELTDAKAAAAAERDHLIAGLKAKHEAALEQLAVNRTTAEQTASMQVGANGPSMCAAVRCCATRSKTAAAVAEQLSVSGHEYRT